MNLGLYVITDRKLTRGRDLLQVVAQAIEGGADVIQLRDKSAKGKELFETGLALRALTGPRGVLFIVNDRVDIALAVDADGVHLGQDDLPIGAARALMGPSRIIGASASNPQVARQAEQDGANYLGVGAMFSTPTKPESSAVGPEMLRCIKNTVDLPIVAIGGITEHNVQEVVRAGADGAAVISAVVGADDIANAARGLKQRIAEARARR